jgi:threonine dehydratase
VSDTGSAAAHAPQVTLADVRAAAARIEPFVHRTPVMTCTALDEWCGQRLFLKCENLQKVGAFKIRGATNAVLQLTEAQAARGVVTHSSGNHAQALALAAKRRGIPAYIVMPENAPAVKRAAVLGYGAEVIPCAATLEARESTAARVQAKTGATFVHPYDDDRIIAGAGTAALELLDEVPDLDVIVAPVGGGGLLSGTTIAAKALRPDVRVVAAEPAEADDAFRSKAAGELIPVGSADTIADGLRTSLSPRTFHVLHTQVDEVIRVSEARILEAQRLIFERAKLVVEPSGAVPVAAARERHDAWRGQRIGLILSGGNAEFPGLRAAD